ncbi:MAG: four helix bundle protein [Bacteroidota bacterium]
MKDFRKLMVWEKAHGIAVDTYAITLNFPKEETYGLTSQMRRAASSVPTNIAEGCGRGSNADFARFIQIALGSSSELEYLFILATDLKYLGTELANEIELRIQEIKKMLTGLIKKLKTDG